MLEMRPDCESCGVDLPADQTGANICTFECTFCDDCVNNKLAHICPNCGGGFEPRPIRSIELLKKYPASNNRKFKG